MTTSATNRQPRIDRLIRITQALGEIFGQENRLISDNRSGDIAQLQSKKQQLATEYMQAIQELALDRADIGGTDIDQLAQLRSLALTLEEHAVSQRDLAQTPMPRAAAS